MRSQSRQQPATAVFIRRVLILLGIVVFLSVLLASKLLLLQFYEHERYTTLSKNNRITIKPIPPNRGLIYDRNGLLIAENIPNHNLEIIPERTDDLEAQIHQLQQLFDITASDITKFRRLLRQRRTFDSVPIKTGLTEDEVHRFAVEQYRFPGVLVRAGLIRNYPYANQLVPVLGYVGRIDEAALKRVDPINYSVTDYIGKIGIEKYFEDELHGTVGYESIETDATGRTVRVLEHQPPVPGVNLHLTIDTALQAVAIEALGDRRGSVVAMIPKTGEVLVLASTPSYDPNLFVRGISHRIYQELTQSPDKPLYNRAIRGQYPLASTIKPFLALRAFDDEIVSPDFAIRDPGWFKLPNSSYVYKDWKKKGHGRVNLHRAVVVSCDTYFYQLAHKMGITLIADTLFQFGLGQRTGIEISEELPGLVPTPEWKKGSQGQPWYPGETIISGIGQGYMLSTPLQLALATATMANRGVRPQPRLLLKSSDSQGEVTYAPTQIVERMDVKPESWDHAHEAMYAVLNSPEGTGRRFNHEVEYTMAGKTGTAQVFSAQKHEHLDTDNLPDHLQDHSLFIAFAPMEDPQIAVAVVVEHSKLAGAVARAVIDHYLVTDDDEALDELIEFFELENA